MNMTGVGSAQRNRWERIVMRRPGLALPRLQALMRKRDRALARAALQGAFFVLERWGRAAELQGELQLALKQVQAQRLLPEAAELSEALGRLHYQRGDYTQACSAWSQTLDWATDDSRSACLARIGLAHLCYALGDWARGGRVLDQAELHYARLAEDPYLRAKIALNRAVSLRATQGPQAAQPALDEALGAARAAGHRDYQAEAIWQHARCARDGGDTALALRLARQALGLAQACGYRWLQAQAALLESELQSGDLALGCAGQALALAEAIQSRALQAAAHGRLAELMREHGELGPSWHHQQQRQRLEATLHQGQLPAQLEALARFDTDPTGADALLLSLADQAWTVTGPEDFRAAWQGLRPRLLAGLGLSDLQLWWDQTGEGRYLAQEQGEGHGHGHGHEQGPGQAGERRSALTAAQAPRYLAALAAAAEPLVCLQPSQHRWLAELVPALFALSDAQARLELPLRVDGRLGAFLVLLREPGAAWSRADISRAGRLAALLERLLDGARHRAARTRPLDQALDEALAGTRGLAEAARRLAGLLDGEPPNRSELAALAARIAGDAARVERELQRGAQLLAELQRRQP
ncbi:MAG: hypothetical protein ABW005_07375 [Burkholderiaceae bacterium]